MKTRNLFGMTVTEIAAASQPALFEKLAKFSKARRIDFMTLTFNEDTGEECATVVWA